MISKIESYKLEKYKESIGQFKPQLDRKIILMMNSILEEFDKGYPPTILVSEIECTLQLLLFFSLPMSFHKLDQLKSFINKVIESLPHHLRATMKESFETRNTQMALFLDKDIERKQKETKQRF